MKARFTIPLVLVLAIASTLPAQAQPGDANADALLIDAIRIATDARAWALKPATLGGPASGEDIGHVTFGDLGYTSVGGTYTNLNGGFTLTSSSGCVMIMATGNTRAANAIYVVVRGTRPDDIIQSEVNPDYAPSCM